DRVAQKVVKLLKLDEVPGTKEQWLESTQGKGSLVAWRAGALQKKLDVKPSRESNVIEISYNAGEPACAAAAATAFAHASLAAARQKAKLQQLAGKLGKNHAQYQRMESELASLKQRLQTETRLITSGFGTATAVSKDKEAELAAAIAAQKQKLLGMRQARDELATLQRDVDNAQKACDGVSQRLTQSRLESQF